MAKNRSFVGGKQSIGIPTLGKNDYFALIRKIRKESERVAEAKATGSEVREGATNN